LEFFVQPEAILVQLANGATESNDMGFWEIISSYLAEGIYGEYKITWRLIN
jgi:hypothetical protein